MLRGSRIKHNIYIARYRGAITLYSFMYHMRTNVKGIEEVKKKNYKYTLIEVGIDDKSITKDTVKLLVISMILDNVIDMFVDFVDFTTFYVDVIDEANFVDFSIEDYDEVWGSLASYKEVNDIYKKLTGVSLLIK